MHYLEHKKEGRKGGFFAIKLDISKAHDRVECGFIKQMMEKMDKFDHALHHYDILLYPH